MSWANANAAFQDAGCRSPNLHPEEMQCFYKCLISISSCSFVIKRGSNVDDWWDIRKVGEGFVTVQYKQHVRLYVYWHVRHLLHA